MHEASGDRGALQTVLAKAVDVAETKFNFSRSRPLRLRLAEVQEDLGDKGGALATLKFFITNGKAVSAPADDGGGGGGSRAGASAEELNELMRRRSVLNFRYTITCAYI